MKKLYLFLVLILFSLSAWADDDLKPEPFDQEVKEYLNFWNTDQPDPSNHEIWKLYIFYPLYPRDSYGNKVPEWFVAGLSTGKGEHFNVEVGVNQLYNFLRPIPERGDVIIVEGRVTGHYKTQMYRGDTEHSFSYLYFYVENASLVKDEHFGPKATPEITPGATPQTTPTVEASVTPTPTLVVPTQGVSVK